MKSKNQLVSDFQRSEVISTTDSSLKSIDEIKPQALFNTVPNEVKAERLPHC